MAIRKALLVKEVNGEKYQIYPKTSADIVVYGATTVEQALNDFANKLSGFSQVENLDAKIKASCDELYNKIMGVTGEDGTTVSDAYDTLKEVGAWIEEHGDVVSSFNDNIALINETIKKLDSIVVDGGEIGDAVIDNPSIIKDIKFKKGTAKRWKELNIVLASGEPGFEYDTGKFKIGDGIHPWKELKYQGSDSNNIEFIDKYNELPETGISNTLYCVKDDKLIYHYNSETSKYEAFGASGSFDPTIITKINGGKANG
jgi:hypothetical protein